LRKNDILNLLLLYLPHSSPLSSPHVLKQRILNSTWPQ
jgi:hypothetical protein